MAGTMVFARDAGTDGIGNHSNILQLQVSWTSDASGNATGTSPKIVGRIIKATVVPGTGGSAPTNSYSIVITDGNSINVLANVQSTLASNSGSSNAETYFLVKDAAGTPLAQSIHPVVCDLLTFTIASSGNTKNGTINLYYEPI